MDPRKASLFDLDYTLLNANSSVCFGRYLFQEGVFSYSRLLQLGSAYLSHKIGIISIAAMQMFIFQKLFSGKSSALFKNHVESFLDKNLEQLLYRPAIGRLRQAQAEGHLIAILSSSPDFLVGPISQRLGVEIGKSSKYAVDEQGQFSHIESLLLGADKAAWANVLMREFGISPKNITAFSDSILDLPFLEVAGIKIGVNPDRQLRALCNQNSWEIL